MERRVVKKTRAGKRGGERWGGSQGGLPALAAEHGLGEGDPAAVNTV